MTRSARFLTSLALLACCAAPWTLLPAAETVADGGADRLPASLAATVPLEAKYADSPLPTIYMPYTPGQAIPCGWRLVTIQIPTVEICTKTVCEEKIVQVPKQVPCTVKKTVRIPTEVYKTYVKFKEIKVEDGVLRRPSEAPQSELDELESNLQTISARRDAANSQPPATLPVAATSGGGELLPPRQKGLGPPRPPRPGYEWVPVTKVRKKRIRIEVPVKKTVEVDEGCWKEIVVKVPCPQACPLPDGALPPDVLLPTTPLVRRVWEPRIVQREVTVLETRETTVDETYVDYVERPAAQPDVRPEPGPDVAPDVMVTEDRTVRVPQYVTKAERHYVTKIIDVPSTKTIYCPVKTTARREVPYEVRRLVAKQILVPIDPRLIPPELLAHPPAAEAIPQPRPDQRGEALPAPRRSAADPPFDAAA